MKTLLKSILLAVIAAIGVPAFAARENHEEFARQYMPESQAVFERFRKDCAETQKLRESLAEDLRVMNRALGDDAGYCALSEKNYVLSQKLSEWSTLLKDAFFKHKAGMISSEKLSETDTELAKESIAWEQNVLGGILKKTTMNYGSPTMVKIPGSSHSIAKFVVSPALYGAIIGTSPSEGWGSSRKVKWGSSRKVNNITWYEAVEFCKKLTKRDRALGRISENQEYQLPRRYELSRAVEDGVVSGCGVEWTSTDWEHNIMGPQEEYSAVYGRGWQYEEDRQNKRHASRAIGFRVILAPTSFFSIF